MAAPIIPIRKNDKIPFSTVLFQSKKLMNMLEPPFTEAVNPAPGFIVTFAQFFLANILYISPGILTKRNATSVYMSCFFCPDMAFSSPIAVTSMAPEYTIYIIARKLMRTFAVCSTLSAPSWSLSRLSPLLAIRSVLTGAMISDHGMAETPANESGARFKIIPAERRI